jgi:WD40 repeat protein
MSDSSTNWVPWIVGGVMIIVLLPLLLVLTGLVLLFTLWSPTTLPGPASLTPQPTIEEPWTEFGAPEQCRWSFRDHDAPVASVAFLDDRTLAATLDTGEVVKWDILKSKKLGVEKGPRPVAGPLQVVSRNGQRRISSDGGRTVKMGDAQDTPHAILWHGDAVTALAMSTDAKYGLSGHNTGDTSIWLVETGKRIGAVNRASGAADQVAVRSVAINPASTCVAVAHGHEIEVRGWKELDPPLAPPDDAPEQQLLGFATLALRAHKGPVQSTAFTRDGKTLVTASTDGRVRLWDLATGQQTAAVEARSPVVVDRDGKNLWIGRLGGLQRWNLDQRDWVLAGVWVCHEFQTSADGSVLFTAKETSLRRYDFKVGKEPMTWTVQQPLTCMALAPDGKSVALAMKGGNAAQINDASTGQVLVGCPIHEGAKAMSAVSFSPDGKRLATASRESTTIYIVDPVTGKVERALEELSKTGVAALAFSPGGKYLAASTFFQGMVVIWDAATGERVHELSTAMVGEASNMDFAPPITSLAFSADGSKLAAGLPDWVVVFDLAKLKPTLVDQPAK